MAMTTRRGIPGLASCLVAALALFCGPRDGVALTLDDRGEMRLGMRAYSAVRIGTEDIGGDGDPLSFPASSTGHVRQHRYFLELKLDHDLKRLANTGWGLARAFGWLDPSTLKYSLQYRGEGEGIYDYGPSEYSDSFRAQKDYLLDLPEQPALGLTRVIPDRYIAERVSRLRRIARQRHRFFLGYLDIEKGPVFVRVGRQILAWGETDVFRLLDNINPLDQGFGGFLIALDERRVPLDMVRASYHFGSLGPLDDSFFEGFAALGDRVSTDPGIPPGSPWIPGGLGAPNPALQTVIVTPDKEDIRGGGRFVFTYRDVTTTLAHYWTYLDTPGVVFRIPAGRPFFPNSIQAIQKVPRVPISGLSITFPLPSWYTIVRSEAAYFYNEPFNRQGEGTAEDALAVIGSAGARRLAGNLEGGLNPFVYPGFITNNLVNPALGLDSVPIRGRLLQRNSFNYALGFDINRFIRQLNAGQTFFISTQFFYKHVFDSPGDLVLPVPARNIGVFGNVPVLGRPGPDNPLGVGCPFPRGAGVRPRNCRLQPRLISIDDDQFLHTLLITTSYRGGRVVPSFAFFYDWKGATLFQPGVALVRDPFRFIFDYTRIESPLGAGMISALRDRDNVRFQIEYVF